MWIIGLMYFSVILIANALGAISGMGGGVLIKPIFDLIGQDPVASISFYSAVAVFTMSIVTTFKQIRNGINIRWNFVGWIAGGSIIGGVVGNNLLAKLLSILPSEKQVLLTQIVVTILTIVFAFMNTKFAWKSWNLKGWYWQLGCGLTLGMFASFLGIGGGPINVALLMLMFGIPIKEATVYSICTILFSQGAKLLSIITITGFTGINLQRLWFIIPAAILGGLLGSQMSRILSTKYVEIVFQGMLVLVILINFYNGLMIFV